MQKLTSNDFKKTFEEHKMIKEIKLFTELVISEYDLYQIINNYFFPREHYVDQLKRVGLTEDNININDNDIFNKLIEDNKNKIQFRTKNIMFAGYSKKETNKYFFFQITTKKKKVQQAVYFTHIKGHTAYIRTNRIFYFNLDKQNVWISKFNTNKSKIVHPHYWKVKFINKIPVKVLKELSYKTSIKIYSNKLLEYKNVEKD